MADLSTPHIEIGAGVNGALSTLKQFGTPIHENASGEDSYRIETNKFSMAIYVKDNLVNAVWYDDPQGRESEEGIAEKVKAYLARHGKLENWELRQDNGWMLYWFNPTDQRQMVYGMH